MPENDAHRSLRAARMTKLRSRLDQAMDEMIRLHECNELGADLVARLRGIWNEVHALELKARRQGPRLFIAVSAQDYDEYEMRLSGFTAYLRKRS
jgi:hypothetical protein